jgi:hypothetical protein
MQVLLGGGPIPGLGGRACQPELRLDVAGLIAEFRHSFIAWKACSVS